MASGVVGANLEFTHRELSFSFLYDVKDNLVDFSLEGQDQNQIAIYKKFFSQLIRKNRFEAIELFKKESSNESLNLFTVVSKILFEFNPSFCDLSKSENTNISNLVCRCFGVTYEEIAKVIDLGARDLTTITNLTKASGGCTSCKNDIISIIKQKTNLTLIPIEEAGEVSTVETQSKMAKLKREKILGLWPLEFLETHIFPMSRELGFEVISLVENVIYIKAQGAVPELESFIRENQLSIVTFYI